MKALMLKEYNKFSFEEVPTPEPGNGEVLVRVKACSICGSDIHGFDGSSGRRIPPIIMGHEASGVIETLGPGVTGWNSGDAVTFDSMIFCGTCFYCRRGQTNLCDNRRVLGVSCDEYRRHGAFAEYVVVPQHILFRLPQGMPFEHAAMLEPLAVAAHAVTLAGIVANRSAVVIGCGTIGIMIIQVLKAYGCARIIAADLEADRLERALKSGADFAMDPSEETFGGKVLSITGNRGADLAFEAVGATGPVRTGIASLRKGGTIVLVGNLAADVHFPDQAVVTRDIAVLGSCAQTGEYDNCIDMVARGVVDVGSIISATAPLSEGESWFKRLYAKEKGLLKVVLIP